MLVHKKLRKTSENNLANLFHQIATQEIRKFYFERENIKTAQTTMPFQRQNQTRRYCIF